MDMVNLNSTGQILVMNYNNCYLKLCQKYFKTSNYDFKKQGKKCTHCFVTKCAKLKKRNQRDVFFFQALILAPGYCRQAAIKVIMNGSLMAACCIATQKRK